MYEQVVKPKDNKSRAVVNSAVKKNSRVGARISEEIIRYNRHK